MKKIICFLIVLSVFATLFICANAATTASVCTEFNAVMKSINDKAVATATTEGIDITFETMNGGRFFKLYLEKNVLSGEFSGEDKFYGEFYAKYIIDACETVLGYKRGAYLELLNTASLNGFTIEDDNLEISNTNDAISFKVNIAKKATFIDLDAICAEVSDFAAQKDKIAGGFYNAVFGKVIVCYVKSSDGTHTVYVGQKPSIAVAAVQSATNFFEFIAGKDVALKFFGGCQNLVKDTSFDKFKIDYDVLPIVAEKEFPIDYKYSKITYTGGATYATPKVTATPSVTPTPFDIDVTPTPTPKIIPQTLAPNMSPVVKVTETPSSSVNPTGSIDPSETIDPLATEDPSATIDPLATEDPFATNDPANTEEANTAEPTQAPDETLDPAATEENIPEESNEPQNTGKNSEGENEKDPDVKTKKAVWPFIVIGAAVLLAIAAAVIFIIKRKK